jgi:hypothetical protein
MDQITRLPVERKLSIEDLSVLVIRNPERARVLFDRLSVEGNQTDHSLEAAVYFLLGMLRMAALLPSGVRGAAVMEILIGQEDISKLLVSDFIGPKRKYGNPGGRHGPK